MAEYYTQSESDARYAAKTHTHALESMGGNNLPADRVEVPESVSASFGNAYTLDEALESIAGHTHTGYAPATPTLATLRPTIAIPATHLPAIPIQPPRSVPLHPATPTPPHPSVLPPHPTPTTMQRPTTATPATQLPPIPTTTRLPTTATAAMLPLATATPPPRSAHCPLPAVPSPVQRPTTVT